MELNSNYLIQNLNIQAALMTTNKPNRAESGVWLIDQNQHSSTTSKANCHQSKEVKHE